MSNVYHRLTHNSTFIGIQPVQHHQLTKETIWKNCEVWNSNSKQTEGSTKEWSTLSCQFEMSSVIKVHKLIIIHQNWFFSSLCKRHTPSPRHVLMSDHRNQYMQMWMPRLIQQKVQFWCSFLQ